MGNSAHIGCRGVLVWLHLLSKMLFLTRNAHLIFSLSQGKVGVPPQDWSPLEMSFCLALYRECCLQHKSLNLLLILFLEFWQSIVHAGDTMWLSSHLSRPWHLLGMFTVAASFLGKHLEGLTFNQGFVHLLINIDVDFVLCPLLLSIGSILGDYLTPGKNPVHR